MLEQLDILGEEVVPVLRKEFAALRPAHVPATAPAYGALPEVVNAMGAGNSHEMSLRQGLTPDHLQARVNTTMRSFNRSVLVVGAPLGGLLADRAGLGWALALAAGLFACSAAMLVRAAPSMTGVGGRA